MKNNSFLRRSIFLILLITLPFTLIAQDQEFGYIQIPETEPSGEVARMIIFSDRTCDECLDLKNKFLPELMKKYPGQIASRIYYFNDDPEEALVLCYQYELKFGLAEGDPPIIFMDGKVLSGYGKEFKEKLEQYIVQSLEQGGNFWPEPAPSDFEGTPACTPTPTPVDADASTTRIPLPKPTPEEVTVIPERTIPNPTPEPTVISGRSRDNDEKKSYVTKVVERKLDSLTFMAVIGTGLIDGINPCAFTTIIFLISYLSVIGRNRKQILQTGIVYTLAVFATYLALGLGMMHIVQSVIEKIPNAGVFVYGITAFVTFIVALLAFRDFFLARKGRFKDMTLQLSDDMKRRIHKSIHSKIKGLGIISAALVLGVLVALFELPCTGQVYLPIIAALSNPQLRSKAIPYLIVYNLMFIIPLIIVFIVAYYGVSSKTIGERFKHNVALIKFIMGIVFLLLTLMLIFMAVSKVGIF